MKKLAIFGMAMCTVLAMSSCKSSESAYKKAYEKAQQQELATEETPVVEETPAEVVETPAPVVESLPAGVTEERVSLVAGSGLKAYSVVCGSFGVQANAEGLKSYLDGQGYSALVVFNAEKAMYRVIVSTHDDRASAAQARDTFKARYPSRTDFQGSWLLYSVD